MDPVAVDVAHAGHRGAERVAGGQRGAVGGAAAHLDRPRDAARRGHEPEVDRARVVPPAPGGAVVAGRARRQVGHPVAVDVAHPGGGPAEPVGGVYADGPRVGVGRLDGVGVVHLRAGAGGRNPHAAVVRQGSRRGGDRQIQDGAPAGRLRGPDGPPRPQLERVRCPVVKIRRGVA